MTSFQQAVLQAVRLIPAGKVASYGQIAAYIGAPRAARQVGWALRSLEASPDFPWWRILNNTGRISIKGNQFANATQQKAFLEAEGINVNDDFTLDMNSYRFRANAVQMNRLNPAPNASYFNNN